MLPALLAVSLPVKTNAMLGHSLTQSCIGTWTVNDWNPMEHIPVGVCLTVYAGGVPEFMAMPLQDLVEQVEQGELKVPIGKVFQLEDIVEAHRMMDANTAGGKIVCLT